MSPCKCYFCIHHEIKSSKHQSTEHEDDQKDFNWIQNEKKLAKRHLPLDICFLTMLMMTWRKSQRNIFQCILDEKWKPLKKTKKKEFQSVWLLTFVVHFVTPENRNLDLFTHALMNCISFEPNSPSLSFSTFWHHLFI